MLGGAVDMDQGDAGDADAAASMASDPSFPAVRDLLLETRDFELLVGSIGPSAGGAGGVADSIQTNRGLLYNYYTAAEAGVLLVETASTLSRHGLELDAVHLYLLAYRFDLGVELVLKVLAPLVSSPLQSEQRQAVVGAAQRVERVVRTQQEAGQVDRVRSRTIGVDAPSSSLIALHKLLCLVNYFDHYHLGPASYDNALTILSSEAVGLVPFHGSSAGGGGSNEVALCAAAFRNPQQTHPQVRRTIANVAVSLMDIYYVSYQIAKRDLHAPSAATMYQPQHAQRERLKQDRLTQLRQRAEALTSFLALIQNDAAIDPDVFAKVNHVSALMSA
jgi:hypothetical protein